MKDYVLLSTIRRYANSSVLLVLATVLALVVANSPWGDTYRAVWEMPVALSLGPFNLFSHTGHPMMTLGEVINDFLMAIFFLSVGLEIKREVLCGELSSPKKALAPVIGACGGMLVPVVIFFLVCRGDAEAERGMAIPMATDIAFSLGCLSVFSKRCPVSLKIFLAALAVADDLGGIIVIAIRYTDHLDLSYLGWAALCVAITLVGNWQRVRTKAFYFTTGTLLWYCMLTSGIHATIAGVVLAFCVPASLSGDTKQYIARIRKFTANLPNLEASPAQRGKPAILSNSEITLLKGIETASDYLISPLQDMEDILKVPINFYIIPLFAFANAGINFDGMSMANLLGGVGLGVFLGLLVGKFCGVFGFTWLFIKLHVIQMPKHGTWATLASVCMICGIGFTVSMFMAALSFPGAQQAALLNDAKLGILCGSVASALAGCLLLHLTLPSPDRLASMQQEEEEE